jgi:methionyl aminopeptidase
MVILKTPEEIKIMAKAGKILARVLQALKSEVKEGVSTKYLDELAKELIEKAGAKPGFLGYKPSGSDKSFPFTLCASINEVVVHGLPNSEKLRNGDLVKLDLGVKYDDFYSDSAITVSVGDPTPEIKKLMVVTEEALLLAIKQAKPGNTLGDIGSAVESHVTGNNYSIIKSLTGHGIGRSLHESPNVLNIGKPGAGDLLKEGMVIAIEPMVSASPGPDGGKVKQLPDESFRTQDGSLSAHFEHTVAISKDGPQVLTKI